MTDKVVNVVVTSLNTIVVRDRDLELKLSAGCYKIVMAVLLVHNLVTHGTCHKVVETLKFLYG